MSHTVTNKTPFIETIYRLRCNEEIVVFEKQFTTSAAEEKEAIFFLQTEYENECTDYPFNAPAFDEAAALWAAKIIYFGAQLLLFRQETAKDINTLFPEYKSEKSEAVQLSADICLKFLPYLINKLKEIDPADILIQKMETLLADFAYSAIGYFAQPGKIQFDNNFMNNDCCRQLMVNRVIAKKDLNTASEPNIKSFIESALGGHQQIFWPTFNL